VVYGKEAKPLSQETVSIMAVTNPSLSLLDPSNPPVFQLPAKRIDNAETLHFWLESQACSDVVAFLMQLNYAMFPSPGSLSSSSQEVSDSPLITALTGMISKLDAAILEAPPDPGPRRFGNKSFRTWYDLVADRAEDLLKECLPETVWNFGEDARAQQEHGKSEKSPMVELKSYLMGSFGSSQRLDYGTGHELSFIAFLGGLWKLGAFEKGLEKDIVLGVIEP
jgi:serine/threonine-protein phosphatase 2A activator